MFVADKTQEKRRSMFGDVSIEEEERIWKEITRKATEDQEEVIRRADELIKEREKNGVSDEEELERQLFVFFDSPSRMSPTVTGSMKSGCKMTPSEGDTGV